MVRCSRMLATALFLLLLATFPLQAAELPRLRGQTIYVPAYSHVYTGPRANPYNLAITLVIRNTDPARRIMIADIDYHDHSGKLVRRYPVPNQGLAPLTSTHIHLEEQDTSGGFAPKFMIRWESDKPALEPIIEALMIGATSGQGISFVSPGRVLQEW